MQTSFIEKKVKRNPQSQSMNIPKITGCFLIFYSPFLRIINFYSGQRLTKIDPTFRIVNILIGCWVGGWVGAELPVPLYLI